MQINKTFGVNPSADNANEGTSDPKAETLDQDLDSFFLETPETADTASQDDWIVNHSTTASYESAGIDRLENYPPALEEIIARNPDAMRFLDKIRERYEATKEGLIKLKESYLSALPNVSASEASILQQKIELANRAIVKSDDEILKCGRMTGDSERLYTQELSVSKDLNGDGWIGVPNGENSLKIVYDPDGNPHYIGLDGNEIKSVILDPDYEAKIWNEGVSQITKEEAIAGDENATEGDIYLRLNRLESSYFAENNKFGTPINIGIPEYIWVKRDEDGEYKTDPSLFADGRLTPPSDKTGYEQIRVANVRVWSEEVMKTTDDKKLYNTYIEFADKDGTAIATIRIEGLMDEGPASARTDSGGYVAASSVGIGFYASNRISAVSFDASGYMSTGRHTTDEIFGKLGVEPLNRPAMHDVFAAFQKKSFDTNYWQVQGEGTASTGGWASVSHNFNYDGGTERYTPESPQGTDTLLSFRTGVFVDGVRGNIIGSQYNDIINVPGVGESTLEGAPAINKGDYQYATVVDGGGGNNIVVQKGKGNLFAQNVSFAWVEATHDDDVVIAVSTPALNPNAFEEDGEKINNDSKNYVYINGAGSSTLYDFGETFDSRHKAFYDGYQNDYYELSGEVHTSNPADPDIVGFEELSVSNQAGDETELKQVMSDKRKAIEDGMAGMDEGNIEFNADEAWQSEYGYAEEQDAEMDGFFNEMFGDVNSFIDEGEPKEKI